MVRLIEFKPGGIRGGGRVEERDDGWMGGADVKR